MSSLSRNQAYAQRVAAAIQEVPRRLLREAALWAYRAVLIETVHDSSQAAYNWVLAPSEGPTAAAIRFRPMRGRSPVGRRGDDGANARAVYGNRYADARQALDAYPHATDVKIYNSIVDPHYVANYAAEMQTQAAYERLAARHAYQRVTFRVR